MADKASFQMSGEHLARTLEATRQRERLNIARRIEDRADLADGKGDHALAAELRVLAEDVKSAKIIRPSMVPTVGVSGGERDPLDDVDAIVAEQERSDHDGLPPVRHMSDEAEGAALVKNLGARGKLNLPRD